MVRLLESANVEVVAELQDGEGLFAAVETHAPDVAITDIKMPPSFSDEGLRVAERIKDAFPYTGLLVLSQYVEPRYVLKLMNSGGGVGYLLKDRLRDISQFTGALYSVASGGNIIDPDLVSALMERHHSRTALESLSQREREVLSLMAEGRSNRAICGALMLGSKTIETHVRNIFTKLGLEPVPEGHRRVLAVLTYLRSRGSRVEN